MMSGVNPIETLGLALGAGFSSGLNLYATVATLGILERFGVIHLPSSLHALSHPAVLTIAVVLYLVEFFADKVPYVDTIWDAVHTFIRPPAAALLAYTAAGAAPAEWRWGAALLAWRSSANFSWHKSQRSRCRQHHAGAVQQLGVESW